MILFHRITPFFIGLFGAASFIIAMSVEINPLLPMLFSLAVVFILLTRLCGWHPRSFQYWNFVGTPILFLLSSFGLFLFLEGQGTRIFLAVTTAIIIFFFSEHVFSYVHLPSKYQAYAIEHLSLAINVLTIFFSSAVGFGLRMVLQTSLFWLSFSFFLMSLFIIYSTLWVSKVEHKQAWAYALAGAVLTTELFAVITFLPSGFYTSAAIIALFFYIFLGLTRANFLEKISMTVLKRYLIIGIVLLLLIIVTSKWL